MIEFLALAAAAQLQTVKLPPVTPLPPVMTVVPPAAEVSGLPDLVIGAIRVVDGNPSFEVRNVGRGPSLRPALVTSCAYTDAGTDRRTCSRGFPVGTLAPGQARWVAIPCYPMGGGLVPASAGPVLGANLREAPESCVSGHDIGPTIWKFSARVDGGSSIVASSSLPDAPTALQPDCDPSFGCIRETDESNNRSEYEAPFPG